MAKFGAGGGEVNPTPDRTTSTFSGTLGREQITTHAVLLGSAGRVDLDLNWTESRARRSR